MVTERTMASVAAAGFFAVLGAVAAAYGNAGPFRVEYPNGDPAAKGVLARLDSSLRPTREARLRVVKEDLDVNFAFDRFARRDSTPLAAVTATYTIENPTAEEVQVDFGFPILRGLYLNPYSMRLSPDVQVDLDGQRLSVDVISNSVIYGIIRQQARERIEAGVAADDTLSKRVAAVRNAHGDNSSSAAQKPVEAAKPATPSNAPAVESKPAAPASGYGWAREALRDYLVSKKKWNARDAALMVEYASMDFGEFRGIPRDGWLEFGSSRTLDPSMRELMRANLGPLVAIGEQKATQFFAQLATQFDKNAATTYEGIFSAWGGDVRERSIDLDSGKVRPREIEVKESDVNEGSLGRGDPTVFARLDYLDPHANIGEEAKASCRAVLKNLPVTFTFAPMNLLHYQVTFPANKTRTVKVSYKQYAYLDTGGTPSYQVAYVVHPASFWDDFGPIELSVQSPKPVACRASLPFSGKEELEPEKARSSTSGPHSERLEYPAMRYQARLEKAQDKTGELFVGINKAAWDELVKQEEKRIKDEAQAKR